MKRLCGAILALAMVFSLGACAPETTWQEQYDLGLRYLSEGNYEQAIIAFTAAIEIDPKQPETYLSLADAYMAQGDTESAKAVLEEGLEATDSSDIGARLEELSAQAAVPEPTAAPTPKPTPAPTPAPTQKPASASPESDFEFDAATGTILDYTGPGGEVVVPATIGGVAVRAIGERVFYECDSLTSITLPDSVTTIGDVAFWECIALTGITLPNGVTTIGDYAFLRCESLVSITLPDSLTAIGRQAFYSCYSLTSITIPGSVTTIGDKAFASCDALTSITIPEGVTAVGEWAFANCASLASITLPEGLTTIGEDAFYGCTSLTSITLPDSLTTIGGYAFLDTALTSIAIPDSVTTIEYFAFYDCDSLTDVYYGGSEEQWKQISVSTGNDDLFNATIHYGA